VKNASGSSMDESYLRFGPFELIPRTQKKIVQLSEIYCTCTVSGFSSTIWFMQQ